MKFAVLILLIGLLQNSDAQNLLINGDFEEVRCLELFEEQEQDFMYSENWYNLTRPYSTCDVFSVCNTIPYTIENDSIVYYTQWGVPDNFIGYRWPQSGNTYVGFLFCRHMNFENPNYSYEYPVGTLSKALEKDSIFCIDLFTAPFLNDTMPYIPDAEEKYIHFFSQFIQGFFLNEFQFKYTRKITETANSFFLYSADSSFLNQNEWTSIQTPYKATGGEHYFALGLTIPNAEMFPHVQLVTNFTEEEKRIWEEINLRPPGSFGVGGWVYYIVDNISITPIPALRANVSESNIIKGASVSLFTQSLASNLQWYTHAGPIGLGDSVQFTPKESGYVYLKGIQCRYTQTDSIWINVEERLPVPITLNVYQNLNQGTVQFEYLGDVRPTLQIAVYNLAGQRVQSFPLSESSIVTLNNLAAGMYLIDARLEGIPVKTAKVVVGR